MILIVSKTMFSSKQPEGKKRFHWQLVTTRNPKGFVMQPAKPDSAKEDLKRFVQVNRLKYRYRPKTDEIDDFEDLFRQLNLNEDEDLLERADRRDLPISIQLLCHKLKAGNRSTIYKTNKSSGPITRPKTSLSSIKRFDSKE